MSALCTLGPSLHSRKERKTISVRKRALKSIRHLDGCFRRKASLKKRKGELAASLHGFYSEHFRWLLSEATQELADLDRKLEQVDKRLAKQLQPHVDLILRLCSIPGVDFTTAAVILAEIGLDMSRFPDAGHLASWAGLSPGNNESAGKR